MYKFHSEAAFMLKVEHPKQDRIILDGHKLAWHKDRVDAWILRRERVAPITIDMALTRACNYKCVYCYSQLQHNKSKPLTEEVLFRFADDAAEIGVKGISLVSDGESTVSKHFYSFIKRAKGNGISMAVGTNGLPLYSNLEKTAEILGMLDYLRFNISAGTPEKYAEVMGTAVENFEKFKKVVSFCVAEKKRRGLQTTLGLQMVLLTKYIDQVIPLVRLGEELGGDYTVIKHCSDNEDHEIGIDYKTYLEEKVKETLRAAESMSTPSHLVGVKWSKILSNGLRDYDHCYGPPLIMQLSGSGLVAPCGMLFNEDYSRYHIGNVADTPFKALWQGERYWKVIEELAYGRFNPHTDCGALCLQHKCNETLFKMKHHEFKLTEPVGEPPMHVNFL